MRKIYLASSWRNPFQHFILQKLRFAGHDVYDFKNPSPGNSGFAWSQVDREWLTWTPEQYIKRLENSRAAADGFALDKFALDWCDMCVIVLPCGRSAHLEAGYAIGQGKTTYFLLHEDQFEPELMYLLGAGCSTSIDEIIEWIAAIERVSERLVLRCGMFISSDEYCEKSKGHSGRCGL